LKPYLDGKESCIFFGNLSDPVYMQALEKVKDKPAIIHDKLGYVFGVGVFVENVK
jgi:hypothetical protein